MDNDKIIAYSRKDPATGDTVLVICTLDSYSMQHGTTDLNMPALGLGWNDRVMVHDEVSGESWNWGGQFNYVKLEPWNGVAHILRIAN